MASGQFEFDSLGIGNLLRKGLLVVPPNQRSYAWEEKHVRDLLQDLNEAISNDDPDYFLGTIVLVKRSDGIPSIADGQQRIATTSILLARMRDYQYYLKRDPRGDVIESQYLRETDMDTEEYVPKLRLNVDDNEYFASVVLDIQPVSGWKKAAKEKDKRASNERLKFASAVIREFIQDLLKPVKTENQSDTLNKWVKFIKDKASVVVVTAPDEVGAYRMFETLNDRGLKASQADILKNFLFSKAGARLSEAQASWSSISGAIESLGDNESARLVTFIRHFWIVTHGTTKERDLASKIKEEITSEAKALNFLTAAASAVQVYTALWSSKHPFWNAHRDSTRSSIDTIAHHLQIEQIRPLMFAVALQFPPAEAEKAFRLFVSWSVRFLVYGGRGGLLDTQYSLRAMDVGTETITTASALRDAMQKHVPTDAEFEAAFATARVSRARLARYYLRAIEKTRQGNQDAEFVPNEEVEAVNLEHVLPLTPGDEWEIESDMAEAAQKLIGNMALMASGENVANANDGFEKKKAAYAKSKFGTTKELASYDTWDTASIQKRQAELAKTAVQTWSTTFKKG
jgi:hypothetical protein